MDRAGRGTAQLLRQAVKMNSGSRAWKLKSRACERKSLISGNNWKTSGNNLNELGGVTGFYPSPAMLSLICRLGCSLVFTRLNPRHHGGFPPWAAKR